jgi:hypothetical protein
MKPARWRRLAAAFRPAQISLLAAAFNLIFAQRLPAQTNTLSESETAGRALVEKILTQMPSQNATNSGTLIIRNSVVHHAQIPVTCETIVTPTNWLTRYTAKMPAGGETLTVAHSGAEPNSYTLSVAGHEESFDGALAGRPFAGSDFWCCDLGLEFFHWPAQKILKKEFHRQCACTVLESTNPNPGPAGYSRVVSWIDNDSLGIVEAYAYDANGKKLKNFYPKNFEKVNGQYQVQSLVMENSQTDSRSTLEFDLEK